MSVLDPSHFILSEFSLFLAFSFLLPFVREILDSNQLRSRFHQQTTTLAFNSPATAAYALLPVAPCSRRRRTTGNKTRARLAAVVVMYLQSHQAGSANNHQPPPAAAAASADFFSPRAKFVAKITTGIAKTT